MLRKIFILTFFSLPLLYLAETPVLDKNSQVVGYAFLKGNGLKEEVVLNGNPYNNLGGYYFKSLKIIDGVGLAYELDAKDGFDDMTVDNYIVAPLRNGRQEQILILLHGSGASGSTMKVIEWDGRKYVETLGEHCWTADVRDLENNREAQIILAQKDQVPHIYDYDPRLRRYAVSDRKHLKYFRKIIDDCEWDMAHYKEDTAWLVQLGKISEAAKIIGDIPKAEDAQRRLNELRIKIAENNASPTKVPTEGIKQ